jgi:hypothetical protein
MSTARNHIMLKRLRFTPGQVGCLWENDILKRMQTRIPFAGGSVLMTADDADTILFLTPKKGRTAMSIRRKVASALRAAEIAAEVRK